VSFEVIEHLENWQAFLMEMRRVLVPTGQFIVSTPNKLYYAETRESAGTYRMRLVFAVVPPADQRGPLVHLCTIYSAAFTLAKEDKWTEFY
jgi:2-polyprenyl-3-methyl-5-hydroxy-6-metoxy-1,4-benzoquinol methylase